MTPYTIVDFNDVTKKVTIRLKDLAGFKHELHVSADGLMRWELGNDTVQDCFPDLNASQRELMIVHINRELVQKGESCRRQF